MYTAVLVQIANRCNDVAAIFKSMTIANLLSDDSAAKISSAQAGCVQFAWNKGGASPGRYIHSNTAL